MTSVTWEQLRASNASEWLFATMRLRHRRPLANVGVETVVQT